MINLHKNIDNDINYLLEQLANNVKIENVDATAIVNNKNINTEFDDKNIITTAEIKRGNYINYNDLNFIVLNEINDRRYNSYNKAIIRNCNYNINFIINKHLFQFPAIVESENSKLKVKESEMITVASDKIIVTLPYTLATKHIKLNDRFISMSDAWKIEHIDLTKNGLVKLTCKVDLISSTDDDEEKEIANINNLLDSSLPALTPFDILPPSFEDEEIPVDPVDPTDPVDPEPEVPATLEITGSNRLTVWDDPTPYTVNTESAVKWTLTSTVLKFSTEPTQENSCMIKPISTSNIGESTLKVELVSDASSFAELKIGLYYA